MWEGTGIPCPHHFSQNGQESTLKKLSVVPDVPITQSHWRKPGVNGYFNVLVDAVRQWLAQSSSSLVVELENLCPTVTEGRRQEGRPVEDRLLLQFSSSANVFHLRGSCLSKSTSIPLVPKCPESYCEVKVFTNTFYIKVRQMTVFLFLK